MKEINLEWGLYIQQKDTTMRIKLDNIQEEGNNTTQDIENIINEIYVLEGLQNIVLHDEKDKNNENLIERLSNIDEDHTSLIILKKIIAKELRDYLQRNNHPTVTLKAHEDVFIEVFDYGYMEYFFAGDFGHEYVEYFLDEHFVLNPNILRSLRHIYVDYLYYFEIGDTKGVLHEKLKYYYVLKSISPDEIGNSTIFLFFLYTILEYLGERLDFWRQEEISINTLIHKYISKINTITVEHQVNLQKDMLLCYLSTEVSNKMLTMYMKDIIDTLVCCEDAYKRYFSKASTGCIAAMSFNNQKYIALSGGDISNKIIDQITNEKYINVKITDEMRYYYKKDKYITLEEKEKSFKTNKSLYSDSEIRKINRMFSCCERKLLTVPYGEKSDDEPRVFVKFKPCFMCERAIDDFENSRTTCRVYYPKKKQSKAFHNSEIKEFDKLGEKIKNNC